MHRRQLLIGSAATAVAAALPARPAAAGEARNGPSPFGELLPADANGLELPAGFSSRVVARTGQVVPGTGYTWHVDPDGGAVFDDGEGGWIYVSNSEVGEAGGVGAIRFGPDGDIADAYPILTGSLNNCAGGPTPWGTWLSCEETPIVGRVWECDPRGERAPTMRLAMGLFAHEAAAVDPEEGVVYLTEDDAEGCYYRFRPTAYPDLAAGALEAAAVAGDGSVTWVPVLSGLGPAPTRVQAQLLGATAFHGGEGCWYDHGHVFFTTKHDNRVWRHDLATDRITVLYDLADQTEQVLRGVDNVVVSPVGDVLVAEDGGNMELVVIAADSHAVSPFLRVPAHIGQSEIAGPAFDASGTRLYFSSQRGDGSGGITYEVTGPFARTPAAPAAPAASPPRPGPGAPAAPPATDALGDARLPATGGSGGRLLGLGTGLAALAALARLAADQDRT